MDKRIIITEADVTSSGSVLSSRDVVYVPGFCYYAEGDAKATSVVGEPLLCSTISEFQEAFGDRPAIFRADQGWPRFDAQTMTDGFEAAAIPEKVGEVDPVMFAANSVDPSYIYACELLARGIPVVYERMNAKACKVEETDVTVTNMYTKLLEVFSNTEGLEAGRTLLTDPTLPIKYFTTGGYPAFEFRRGSDGGVFAAIIARLAQARGDALALIDHTNKPKRRLCGGQDESISVFLKAQTVFATLSGDGADSYISMFTPWANYTLLRTYKYDDGAKAFDGNLPGSYAYLVCLANVIKTNPAWTAIAGVARGQVPQLNELCLDATRKLTNAVANYFQPDPYDEEASASTPLTCINAITNIKGYGYCIWGDRTLRTQIKGLSGYALNFLHIRNLICDIKKLAYDTSVSLMFEPNSNTLWGNFKGALTPTLDRMKATQGISGYSVIKLPSDTRTKLVAKINIYPMYAVEKFEININITDEEVSVG